MNELSLVFQSVLEHFSRIHDLFRFFFASGISDLCKCLCYLQYMHFVIFHIFQMTQYAFCHYFSDDTVPDEYLCPITREIMKDPVIAAGKIITDSYVFDICVPLMESKSLPANFRAMNKY